MISFKDCYQKLPLIAILRGIQPHEILATVESLIDAGFSLIEIPLNSPDPFVSIKIATNAFGNVAMIGAGTVINQADVTRTLDAGGRLVVAPNVNTSVGERALAGGAIWAPGVATPTEAFSALKVGAHALKIFPAEMVLPSGIKAMCAVLPPSVPLLPVGGIAPKSMRVYVEAGATGFGLGSALYQAGDPPQKTYRNAVEFVTEARHLFNLS